MCGWELLLLTAAAAVSVPGGPAGRDRAGGDVGCSENELLCSNGRCVSVLMLCDGRDDCHDWSDEQNCTISECGPHEFQCNNSSVCISKYWLCDGHQDCPSGADESDDLCKDTAMQHGNCGEFEFRCNTGQCIELQSACDNFPDCTDGSDEANCNRNECLEANGKCSDYCWDLPLGYECACPAGLELINHFTCVDVDDCRNSNVCDQICVNLHGSYKCECYHGYQKDLHSGTCHAAGEEPFVIFTNHGNIRKLSINRMEYEELADSSENAETLAVDIALSTIYWSDATHQGIFSKSTDQESKQIISDVQRIGGIAVDWIYGHIYWTESGARTLSFATLDGLRRKTLFSGNLAEPAAVVVDPYSGVLYWADVGEPAKIEKAGMDGVGRRILVSIGIEKPTGLALDFIKNRLYWVDAGLHELFYSDPNGHYQRSVLDSKKYLTNPFGLAVFENRVYWSDEESKTLYSGDKFTGANVTVLAQNLTEPRSLVLSHKLMQPVVKNWCVEARAACEFLCVPALDTAQHYACLCPDTMKPDETGHGCRMEMNWSTSQEEGEDSGASQEEGEDSGTSQEEGGDFDASQEEGEDSGTSQEEGGDFDASQEEGEDSNTSQEEKSNRADLSYLDAASVGIIAVIVFLTGTVMCCASVHWRMILSHIKKSRRYSPVHLAAENSLIYNGQQMDTISQHPLL